MSASAFLTQYARRDRHAARRLWFSSGISRRLCAQRGRQSAAPNARRERMSSVLLARRERRRSVVTSSVTHGQRTCKDKGPCLFRSGRALRRDFRRYLSMESRCGHGCQSILWSPSMAKCWHKRTSQHSPMPIAGSNLSSHQTTSRHQTRCLLDQTWCLVLGAL